MKMRCWQWKILLNFENILSDSILIILYKMPFFPFKMRLKLQLSIAKSVADVDDVVRSRSMINRSKLNEDEMLVLEQFCSILKTVLMAQYKLLYFIQFYFFTFKVRLETEIASVNH